MVYQLEMQSGKKQKAVKDRKDEKETSCREQARLIPKEMYASIMQFHKIYQNEWEKTRIKCHPNINGL